MASELFNFYGKWSFSKIDKSRKEDDEEVSSHLDKLANILMEIQKIILWNDPCVSSRYIIYVNIVFWLYVFLDFRFYGILFSAMLAFTLRQLCSDYSRHFVDNAKTESPVREDSSSSTQLRILTSSEISSYLKRGQSALRDAFTRVKLFRRTHPGRFCIATCLCFLGLGLFGRFNFGVTSLYILLMLAMTVPGAFVHFALPYLLSSLSEFYHSSQKEGAGETSDDIDPFVPQVTQEVFKVLKSAESPDLSLNEEQDSLVDINFQSRHFNGESSDEEEFVKGLKITEVEACTKEKEESNEPLSESLFSMEGDRTKKATNQERDARNERESSSDTESFELVSEEDM